MYNCAVLWIQFMCNQLSDLGPNMLNVWTLRTLNPVGNSGYYVNRDFMDLQVVCEYQEYQDL